ncbi:MAG: DUF6629 family protein [Acidimicrobiales bacterium]
MCFSADGDLTAGVVIVAVGVDACRHLEARPEYRFVAALPVLLGLHQIDEAFVWWSLRGMVPPWIGTVAMWIYLVFALVALPVVAPLLVVAIEPTRARRWRIAPFVALGVLTGALLLTAMLRTHPTAHLGSYHLAYSIGLRHGILVTGLYIVATCGPMLVSGFRHVFWFGVSNLVAIAVLARLCADGFTSLWCFYAALASGAIALYLRFAKPGHASSTPLVGVTSP